MSPWLAGVAIAFVVLLLQDPARARTRRVVRPSRVLAGARMTRAPAVGGADPRRDVPLATTVAFATALVVGGADGVVGAIVVAAVAMWLLRRSRRQAAARADAALLRQLPLAADLIAACLAAGAGPDQALREVSTIPGPLGDALRGVVRATALGAAPSDAWGPVIAGGSPPLRTLAAALVRASVSGASPGPVVEALASDLRDAQRLAGEGAARRAGVAMVAPLGLCFLPAFVLIGVVPLVAGLVTSALSAAQ